MHTHRERRRRRHSNTSHSTPNDYNYQLGDWALVIMLCTFFDHYHSVFFFSSSILFTYSHFACCLFKRQYRMHLVRWGHSIYFICIQNIMSPQRSKFPISFSHLMHVIWNLWSTMKSIFKQDSCILYFKRLFAFSPTHIPISVDYENMSN